MNDLGPGDVLDRAIDVVASELTRGLPSRNFAERVHARLARPRRVRPGWLALAAGTVAVVLLVLLSRAIVDRTVPKRGHPGATEHAKSSLDVPLANAPAVRSVAPGLPNGTREMPPIRHSRREPIEPMSIAVSDALQIASLPEIPDLTLTVNEPAALELTDLNVPDLAVLPLDPGPSHERKEMR